MAKPIKITIFSHEDRGGAPTVGELLSQVKSQVGILEGVDAGLDGNKKGQLIWRVANVSTNSPITFEIIPDCKKSGIDIEERAGAVIAAVSDGLRMLQEGGGMRPDFFTDKALKAVRDMNKRVMNGFAGSVMDFSEYDGIPTYEVNRATAEKVVRRVETITSSANKPYRELGSIEGYIKAIKPDNHGRIIIVLKARLDGQIVNCIVDCDNLQEVDNLQFEKIAEGARVYLHGMLYYKSLGVLDRVEVERVEIIRTEGLPTLRDLIDKDFTGGLSSAEYLRRRRTYD